MPTDILLNDDYDALIADGDFVAGESTYQHQALLLLSAKGEFKENTMRCVGAQYYLETGNTAALAREIDTEYSRDGMTVSRINVAIPKIEVEAKYDN